MRSLFHMLVKLVPLIILSFNFLILQAIFSPADAIDIQLTMEKAKQAMSDGRESMEKAEKVEEVANIMKAAERAIRVGIDPEKDPCGPHAILRTRYYWLEYFGRREAAESKRHKNLFACQNRKSKKSYKCPI